MGQIVESYELQEEIGKGGFGKVYRCIHTKTGKTFAIKQLTDVINKKRFDRECALLCNQELFNSQESQFVVRGIESFTANDNHYLVMELVEGDKLTEDEYKGIPVLKSLEFINNLLKGVEFLHGIGCIHRDIKPANLFCIKSPSRPDFIKIVDLGIAHVDDGFGVTDTGTRGLGSKPFSAPECYRSMKETSPPTDIFSVGAVLFYLITGLPPAFELEMRSLDIYSNDFERWKDVNDPWECFALGDFVTHCPRGVSDFAQECMKKDMNSRPQTAAECRDILTKEIEPLNTLRDHRKLVEKLRETLIINISAVKKDLTFYDDENSIQNFISNCDQELIYAHERLGPQNNISFLNYQPLDSILRPHREEFLSHLDSIKEVRNSLRPKTSDRAELERALQKIEKISIQLLSTELKIRRSLAGII